MTQTTEPETTFEKTCKCGIKYMVTEDEKLWKNDCPSCYAVRMDKITPKGPGGDDRQTAIELQHCQKVAAAFIKDHHDMSDGTSWEIMKSCTRSVFDQLQELKQEEANNKPPF